MTFVFVYIKEAHASDEPGRRMKSRVAGKAKQARTATARHETASKCVDSLGLTMTTLVDDMDNSTSLAYDGFPDRLFVIDRNMKIVFRGDRGPFGLDPDAWKRGVQRVIADDTRSSSGRVDPVEGQRQAAVEP